MPAFHTAITRLSSRRTPRLLPALALLLALAGCATGPKVREVALPGKPAVLLAAGDIADCRYLPPADTGAERTAKLVERELAAEPGATVLTLGDNTYPVGLPAEFRDCYQPTWGRFKERTLPTPGNHEYYTAGAPGYYQYFAAHAGPAGKGYYAASAGSWKLIALNTALRNEDFKAQLQWLQAELERDPRACTLAYFHHPAFSSGGHGSNAFMLPVWKLLAGKGVDLVLAAHDHHYERMAPMDAEGRPDRRGLRQFIVGTGGATQSPLWLPLPATEARDHTTLGVLKLWLRDGGYSWRFLGAGPGSFSDEGEGLCH